MMKKCTALLLCLLLAFACPPVRARAVSAQAYAVINGATGTVLNAGNAHVRLPMASTTKIMTALLLCEQPDLDVTLVTTREMVTVEGSSMGLLEGDTVSYRALVYGLLLESGNDAANTTAIALGGSLKGFADMMNQKAASLGLADTHFVTPSGLDDENHYTTAYDLAQLAAYAMRNPTFREAASSKTATVEYGNPPYKRTLSNHNKLLNNYAGAIGVKTGFTKKSGRCLVSAAQRGGSYVIAVTLNDPNDWADHAALLDGGLNALQARELTSDGIPQILPLVGAQADAMRLSCTPPAVGLTEQEWRRVTLSCRLPAFLYAPVAAGEQVGEIHYLYQGRPLASCAVYAAGDAACYIPPPPGFFEIFGRWVRLLLSG